MVAIDPEDHRNCPNDDTSDKPAIETIRMYKGEVRYSVTGCNVILFIFEGKLRFSPREISPYDGEKGEMMFLAAGNRHSYEALTDAAFIVFRIRTPIVLCEGFPLDRLFRREDGGTIVESGPKDKTPGRLIVNTQVKYFFEGIRDCLIDGVRCRLWFELKSTEFFMLLRFYYSRDDLYGFFRPVLTLDTAFSEYVRCHWREYRSVTKMAEAMYMKPKQFSRHFISVFGVSPYRWMSEGKGRHILHEITSTGKTFKQIAKENGYGHESQFTRFCRKEFGRTPTQIREGMCL